MVINTGTHGWAMHLDMGAFYVALERRDVVGGWRISELGRPQPVQQDRVDGGPNRTLGGPGKSQCYPGSHQRPFRGGLRQGGTSGSPSG